MLHIYCGDGKGKTTAALGLAVRAAGSGMRVHIAQLLKGSDTSELKALRLIPGITVARCERDYGFTFNMSSRDKLELTKCHNSLLADAKRLMEQGTDMLIIDEFFAAYNYGLLDCSIADRLVFGRPSNAELILTGRNPSEKFIAAADYVSEINAVKHPYSTGTAARRGIEY